MIKGGNTIIVFGADGYIGNALVQSLLELGEYVIGVDNGWRRRWVSEMESVSALPIDSNLTDRAGRIKLEFDDIEIPYQFEYITIHSQSNMLRMLFEEYKPNVVINLAHNPSAPYSMKSMENAEAVLYNNIINTNNILWTMKDTVGNDCHYITIGTAGEYDHYGNIDIEEGYFSFEHKGRQSNRMIFPRRPGSIYHVSKTASTYLIDYLARAWQLRCTDVMQGIVFGSYTPVIDRTKIYSRLDSDEAGGTVINRFCVQATLGVPLTVYGNGEHQRSFLSLADSIQAMLLAVYNPADNMVVQTWNQLSEWHSMNSIANMVYVEAKNLGLNPTIEWIDTPRAEYTGKHYYNFRTKKLRKLGYRPSRTIKEEIRYVLNLLKDMDGPTRETLKKVVKPKINFVR